MENQLTMPIDEQWQNNILSTRQSKRLFLRKTQLDWLGESTNLSPLKPLKKSQWNEAQSWKTTARWNRWIINAVVHSCNLKVSLSDIYQVIVWAPFRSHNALSLSLLYIFIHLRPRTKKKVWQHCNQWRKYTRTWSLLWSFCWGELIDLIHLIHPNHIVRKFLHSLMIST